jgi:hypothetical protein
VVALGIVFLFKPFVPAGGRRSVPTM